MLFFVCHPRRSRCLQYKSELKAACTNAIPKYIHIRPRAHCHLRCSCPCHVLHYCATIRWTRPGYRIAALRAKGEWESRRPSKTSVGVCLGRNTPLQTFNYILSERLPAGAHSSGGTHTTWRPKDHAVLRMINRLYFYPASFQSMSATYAPWEARTPDLGVNSLTL
jgi:hypothetical protein